MAKSTDKRLFFVAQAVNMGYNAELANSWYISHNGKALATAEALRQFKEWAE